MFGRLRTLTPDEEEDYIHLLLKIKDAISDAREIRTAYGAMCKLVWTGLQQKDFFIPDMFEKSLKSEVQEFLHSSEVEVHSYKGYINVVIVYVR